MIFSPKYTFTQMGKCVFGWFFFIKKTPFRKFPFQFLELLKKIEILILPKKSSLQNLSYHKKIIKSYRIPAHIPIKPNGYLSIWVKSNLSSDNLSLNHGNHIKTARLFICWFVYLFNSNRSMKSTYLTDSISKLILTINILNNYLSAVGRKA